MNLHLHRGTGELIN